MPTNQYGGDRDWRDHPPIGDPPFELGCGLSIVERLPGDLNELVIAACDPRGHFFIPVPQFGVRQAYVRQLDLADYESEPYAWDRDGTISVAHKLSRIVRDNAVSTEYAARIVDRGDGQTQVIPGPVTGEWATAYRAGVERDWLDGDDAGELRNLVHAYWANQDALRGRLDRAVARCEESAHCRFAEDAIREVVTGLEALLKTHRHQATRQFVERVPPLARELGIRGVTKRLCEQAYRWRSQVAHGTRVSMFSGRAGEETPEATGARRRTLDKAALLQSVLRTAVRRALLEPGFRRTFPAPGGHPRALAGHHPAGHAALGIAQTRAVGSAFA